MNTNKTAKRVLLYGDSLVFGKVSGANARHEIDVRWSGQLQALLGDDYEIIEEGLRARMLAGENSFFPERNGLEQFGPIIGSHLGVDLLVIALGTNDANKDNNFSTKINQLDKIIDSYLSKLNHWCEFLAVKTPVILFLLPPDIYEANYDEGAKTIFGEGAAIRVKTLKDGLKKVLAENSLNYIDASEVCKPASGDGIHLDEENNKNIAVAIEQFINTKL